MFLEHYKLQANPFGVKVAKPYFESRSGQQAALRLEYVLEGSAQTLFLTGPAGVGKTALVGRRLRDLRSHAVSWVRPADCSEREDLLVKLLEDLGLDAVDGTIGELRNILEVFLRHQIGNDRRSLLVADGLESMSAPVFREIEWLSQLRLRNRPVIDLVLMTRSEDLVRNLMPENQGGQLARNFHQRLNGFLLEETRTYILACLHGAGCPWEEELIPEEAIIDIQAFTHGVVGDINTVCAAALDMLAERRGGNVRPPKLTRALLKEAGSKLGLQYDPAAWQLAEEALTPDAVQLSDPQQIEAEAARLFVSSGGRTIAEIALNRPRMVLGRDESCDISLDSSYVSRYQNLFMETTDGWVLIDLHSTNGSFVNGRRVREHRLKDGDMIAVGRHQLRFAALGTLPARPGGPQVSKVIPVNPTEAAAPTEQTRINPSRAGRSG